MPTPLNPETGHTIHFTVENNPNAHYLPLDLSDPTFNLPEVLVTEVNPFNARHETTISSSSLTQSSHDSLNGNIPILHHNSTDTQIHTANSRKTDTGLHLTGTPGNDTLTGGKGPDVIVGDSGDDIIKGGKGRDYIDGGAGKDTIDGGPGNDTIIASYNNSLTGADVITLGSGRDNVLIKRGIDGTDLAPNFTDFNPKQDTLTVLPKI